jgi:hypothetical protein
MNGRIWSAIASAFLAACVLLGGASAAGALANAVLQMLSVVIILGLLWTRRITIPAQARPLIWIVGLYLAFVLASLIPLPFSVWAGLPYRAELADGLRMAPRAAIRCWSP